MPSIGGEFTWTNNSLGDEFKQTRLDKAFINQLCIDFWSDSRLEFFNGTSNHKGRMIVTFSLVKKDNKPFKLFSSWVEDPEVLALARAGLPLG